MELTTGTLLRGDTYKIEKTLGQGSFGITYLAEHTSLAKKVAIKEFFMKELNSRGKDGSITGMSDGSLSHNYGQKFKKEAINLSQLEHPNIVRVTDSFEENGTYYYVMDYIEGCNLNDYLKQHTLTPDEAKSIITDVAKALKYMHEEKKVLHLDLKPGNIMRRSSDGHIFIIDFGLSKHFAGNGQPETSTTIGLGTAGYAPVEQSNQARNGEFCPTIDVYALGATFYKLLTREAPPDASVLVSDDTLLHAGLQKHNVPAGLMSAIEQAMMPNVKKRTQNMQAFIDSLSAPAADPTPGTEEETIVAGGGTNDEATTLGTGITGATPAGGTPPTPPAPRHSKSSMKTIAFITLGILVTLGIVCSLFFIKCTNKPKWDDDDWDDDEDILLEDYAVDDSVCCEEDTVWCEEAPAEAEEDYYYYYDDDDSDYSDY